ncbi:MAG: bifunctional phosphoribosyl-AMP cyclohydrolase/phosphoribosyl-ATP diphosphatase HisIE [Pseudomonadota bacterium]
MLNSPTDNGPDWVKMDGLLPAVVQDAFDGRILMVGYMNETSLDVTIESGKVTFWSRSRQELWTKGETSGNTLNLVDVTLDCDRDCLLVRAQPAGPTCHTGAHTCFDPAHEHLEASDGPRPDLAFLGDLERVIRQRDRDRPAGSYTTQLLEAGIKRIAQKVGEEGVETALAAAAGDPDELLNESSDLLYHLLVLLRARQLSLSDLLTTLESRHG